MSCSNIDVIKVTVLEGYSVKLEFEDGAKGNVDISEIVPFKGIFEPLKDKDYFSRVSVNHDIGTICWENGADISPTILREAINR